MSTKNRSLKAGLAAFGLIWTSATDAGAQEAVLQPPAPMPAPAPTNAPTFAVLLLSNGRVIQGNVTQDKTGSEYLLLQKGGTIRFPKKDVEHRFASMRELYDYKVANLADRDTGERMQMAQWCLENHMDAEAREHLQILLSLNPKDTRAERMVVSMDANAARKADNRDPEVRTTSATVAESAPRELSSAAMPRPRGQLGRPSGPPVIFDLPAPVARKRAHEFAQYVHPVLQRACASCHNHTYQGDFQLIQPTSRREWTDEVVRANLDVTLRLVNRNDPLHSDVLSYGVNPHGPNTRAVFHGPNDPQYQDLSRWLKALKSAEPVNNAGYSPGTGAPRAGVMAAPTEGFGVDRFPSRAGVSPVPDETARNGAPRSTGAADLYEIDAVSPYVPSGTRFETPFVPGGTMPKLPPIAGRTGTNQTTPPVSKAKPAGSNTNPGAAALANLPPGTPVPPPDDVIPPTNRAKKKKNLDPALLEQLLKNRQQP